MPTFLKKTDYARVIREENLDEVLDSDYTLLPECEESAVTEVKMYLDGQYDLSNQFKAITAFNLATNYAIGERVCVTIPEIMEGTLYQIGQRVAYQSWIYEAAVADATLEQIESDTAHAYWYQIKENSYLADCKVAGSGVYPDANKTKWNMDGLRNVWLTQAVVDITMYHLFSRVMPRQVTELRVKRYDDTIRQLKQAAAGTLSVSLPLKTACRTARKSKTRSPETRCLAPKHARPSSRSR